MQVAFSGLIELGGIWHRDFGTERNLPWSASDLPVFVIRAEARPQGLQWDRQGWDRDRSAGGLLACRD
jgi:hypothetical protein